MANGYGLGKNAEHALFISSSRQTILNSINETNPNLRYCEMGHRLFYFKSKLQVMAPDEFNWYVLVKTCLQKSEYEWAQSLDS